MVRTSVFADCVTRLIHGRVHVGNKDKQSRPDASIQAFNLSHNHAHRETQRDPRLHLPISPHAFLRYATFPHMHYCVMRHSPTCILASCDIPHMHSCVMLADCARDSVQHGAQLHIDSHICRNTFAKQRDPRITRIIHLPACMCGLRKRT